ncbi:hypothetical protein Tco_1550979, partial [Tanacetum coccineum]
SYFTDSTSGSTSGDVDGNCYGGSGVEVMTGEGSMEGVDNVPGNGDGFIAGSCLMLDSMLHLDTLNYPVIDKRLEIFVILSPCLDNAFDFLSSSMGFLSLRLGNIEDNV